MGLIPSLKKKMKLIAVVATKGVLGADGDSFEVMINPATLSWTAGVCYSTDNTPGAIGNEHKFYKSDPDKLNFEIVVDGTGVVGLPVPGIGYDDVKTQIKKIRNVVSKFDGSKHDVNIVKILWGKNIFHGRLESMSMEYTLFKMGGDPLRAKVKLSFSEFLSIKEQVKAKSEESPDMTHYIEFKASDTLPGLCREIYGDAGWYLEVARANRLVNYRNIPAGTRLVFPPLR